VSASDAARASTGAVAETFQGDKLGVHWTSLARSYEIPSPSCPLSFDEVKSFADHQKELTAGGRAASPLSLVRPLSGWTLAKLQCLIFTLMAASDAAKADEGFEPLHLMRALQQTRSPFAKDNTIRSMFAVRLIQLSQYAETLRVLMDLQDVDPAYRLPYEIVQRIFSIRQKGDGSVALQGI
jgi:hypothetical protein